MGMSILHLHFFLALFTKVHMDMSLSSFYRFILFFMVQIYKSTYTFYIIHIIYATPINPQITLSYPSRPPQISMDASPSLQLPSPPLRLPQLVWPQVRVPISLRKPPIWTWNNLVQKSTLLLK